MYDSKDILALLQEGQKAEDIAQAFADALNNAIDEKGKLDKEAAEARKAAEQTKKNKIYKVCNIVDDILMFIKEYYPDVAPKSVAGIIDPEKIVNAMDEAYEEVRQYSKDLDQLIELLHELLPEEKELEEKKKDCNCKATYTTANSELNDASIANIIDEFLKKNNLF